jgi:predicted nucleic acid-binding protein
MRVLIDTSCVVAAVLSWHEDHAATVEDLRRRPRRGDKLVLAAHTLVESYAVLTRLPANRRLEAQEAWTLLRANWSRAELVGLTPAEHWALLENAAEARIEGGQSYDALIAACARKAGVDLLLTWNLSHFARLAGPFRVSRPGQPASR